MTVIRLLFIFLIFSKSTFCDEFLSHESEYLRQRLEQIEITSISVLGDQLHKPSMVREYYQRRFFQPFWLKDWKIQPEVQDLILILNNSQYEGLNPQHYHVKTIWELLSKIRELDQKKIYNIELFADLEFVLTDALITYSTDLAIGSIDPATVDPAWNIPRHEFNPAAFLEEIENLSKLSKKLAEIAPANPGYLQLIKSYKFYDKIAVDGDWPKIDFEVTEQNTLEKRTTQLIKRLQMEGYNVVSPLEDEIRKQLQIFQANHGLKPTGELDVETVGELNISAHERTSQIGANLERWRWLPHQVDNPRVEINISDFKLRVIENDNEILSMNVIVGKSYRPTPVFASMISYLVINPTWFVPRIIAINDLLPQLKNNPQFFANQNIHVLDLSQHIEVDPNKIDWQKYSMDYFPFQLRQEPGPSNALGRIKFMFPNSFDVYLHDTPSRELFSKQLRTFSSGCVRIEKPLEFARYLLNSSHWTIEAIQASMEEKLEQTISLQRPVAVNFLYWTAWAENGAVQFRKDIYDRDKVICSLLN